MKKIFLVLTTLLASLTLFSCASTKEIPADLTVAQLIQNAQNCYEKADYKGALHYYNTALDRYDDLSIFVEVTYEIGHIYLKMNKYELAYENFMDILGVYKNSSYGAIPTAYKKLAEIGISKIPEKRLEACKNHYAKLVAEAENADQIEWDE